MSNSSKIKLHMIIKYLNTSCGDISSFEEQVETERSNLYSVLASAPSCLHKTAMISKIDALNFDCLFDTGASDNFMSDQVAKTVKLWIQGKPARISKAVNNLTARELRTVCSDVRVQERNYSNVKFGTVPKLCADAIFGARILKKVVLKLGGPKEELVVKANSYSSVSATSIKLPRWCRNLVLLINL